MLLLLTFLPVLLAQNMSHQVQEHEVRFALFTRNLWNVSLTKDNLCLLDRNEDIKILSHGKADYAKPQWILDATDIYLRQGNPNVIQVDWTDVAGLGLITPIYKARDAAYFCAKLIRRIHKKLSYPLERIHLMGHSLGGHFVGFTGKHIKAALNASVGRITGLDPAVDDFSFDPDSENGIQKTDALLVPVIHADDTGLGSRGHIDFYANGGTHPQPGCETALCSHYRATGFFVEALENLDGFLATKCDTYENYLNGTCDGNDQITLNGELLGHQGDYFFSTNAERPYSKT